MVVSQSQTEGRGSEGKEEAERAANVACVVTRSSFAPTNSIYVVTPECKQRYRGSCQSGGEGKGKRLNKVSVRSSPERLVMTISPVYKQSLEIPSPWLRSKCSPIVDVVVMGRKVSHLFYLLSNDIGIVASLDFEGAIVRP